MFPVQQSERRPPYRAITEWALLLLMILASLWLRAAYGPVAVFAPHDDLHFIHMAEALLSGNWLGHYDQMTHTKGAAYSLFMAVNHLLGWPLKLTEHLAYLLASLATVVLLTRMLSLSRWRLPLFALLAFSPLAWSMALARMMRENLYLSESLLLFGLVAYYLLGQRSTGWRRWLLGAAIGLVGGFFWLTREEGIWLLPALLVLGLPMFLRVLVQIKQRLWRQAGGAIFGTVALPALFFLLTVGAFNALNYSHYGVFRNNDFRDGPFVAAYGALARIDPASHERYVVFGHAARELAYRESPAAAALRPQLDGPLGQGWARASHGYRAPWGCSEPGMTCPTEILAGWFLWALRDSVANLGYYRKAALADNYYQQLADEINRACELGRLPCGPERNSMRAVWRWRYLADVGQASLQACRELLDYPAMIGVSAAPIPPATQARFEAVINQSAAAPEARGLRAAITQGMSRAYLFGLPFLFVLALVSYLLLLKRAVRVPASRVVALILTALLVGLASRIGVLALIEATAFPGINLLYLAPAVPFHLLFIGLAVLAFPRRLAAA